MDFLFLLISAVIVVVPWLTARRYGLLPWVSPLHIVSYFALFGVLLKTIVYIFAPDVLMFSRFITHQSAILSGYLFLSGFVFFISLGYVAGVRRRTVPQLQELTTRAIWQVRNPWLWTAVSIAIFLLAALSILSARGFSGISALFSTHTLYELNTQKIARIDNVNGFGNGFAALKSFFIIPTFAFMVWLSRQIARPAPQRLIMALLTGLIVVFSIIFQAKRMELADLLIYYLCLHVLLGYRVRAKMLLKLMVAFIAIFLLFVVMTTLRATKGGLDNAEFALLEPLLQIGGSTYFLDLNMPIVLFDRAGSYEHFGGASYFYWVFGWIPRSFWVDKPAITLGPYVKQTIFGLYGSIGGINPTGPGEAILNFGWAGMLVGAPLGWIYRRLEEYLLKPRTLSRKGGVWLYPLVFYPFIQGTLQSSFSATLIGAVTSFVLLRVGLAFASRQIRLGRSVTGI